MLEEAAFTAHAWLAGIAERVKAVTGVSARGPGAHWASKLPDTSRSAITFDFASTK